MCKHTRHLFVCEHYGRWPNTQGKMKRLRLLNPRLLFCVCAVLRTRCGLTFHLQQASTCQRYMDLEKIGAFCIILWAQRNKANDTSTSIDGEVREPALTSFRQMVWLQNPWTWFSTVHKASGIMNTLLSIDSFLDRNLFYRHIPEIRKTLQPVSGLKCMPLTRKMLRHFGRWPRSRIWSLYFCSAIPFLFDTAE